MDGGLKGNIDDKALPLTHSGLRSRMKEADVDVLVISATSDMRYLIGRKLPNTERFNALILA